ncbi:MAG TPA: hypothetical protein VM433_12925 [Mycobacteriales bacterium]|nr:hypothetical protein [Mycobacteriales bacterium]
MAGARDDVPLTDLEVVQRYSLAVRAATAPREELVAALEADLAWLTRGRPGTAPASGSGTASRTGAARTGTTRSGSATTPRRRPSTSPSASAVPDGASPRPSRRSREA